MATQTTDPSNNPSAHIVGIAFVKQYYCILLNRPADVHKFYNDSSVISRPGPGGLMTSATTMQGINEKFLSLDLKEYKPEILTIDAQDSYMEGVIVLVTGCLTGKDSGRRNFTQIFFLARQEKGYYVLNDVFRFVGEDQSLKGTSLEVMETEENSPPAPVTPDSEPSDAVDHTMQNDAPTRTEEVSSNVRAVSVPSDTKVSSSEIVNKGSFVEEVVGESPTSSRETNVRSVAESGSSAQEDTRKVSYASILAKEGSVDSSVHVPTSVTVSPLSTDQQSLVSTALKARAPCSSSVPQSSSAEVTGIYVGNLPSDVTAKQLEAVFKAFGHIKQNGIQIRRFQEDGFCYGFVDFESSNSARSAIEVHKITIGDKAAYIEEKRTSNRVANDGGRFPSGKAGFRNDNFWGNDNFRGRENFGGGRGYGRYEHENHGEYSSQARGRTGQSGETYRRGFQNGGGRVARQGEMK